MKVLIGILGVIAGILLGIYVGFWLCFIGGIIGVMHVLLGLFVGKILVGTLVLSVVKILFAGLAGYISGSLLILPSWALIVSGR